MISTSRAAAFTGFTESLSSSYSAGSGQLFGELGYGMDVRSARFEPFADLACLNHATDDFVEQGGAAALAGADEAVGATFTAPGLRASTELAMGGTAKARLTDMAGWRRAFGDVPTAAHSFAAGGDAFTVVGAPIAQDALVLKAGFDVEITPEAKLGALYTAQIGSGVSDHSIKVNLGVRI